jgi:hypothetical protein
MVYCYSFFFSVCLFFFFHTPPLFCKQGTLKGSREGKVSPLLGTVCLFFFIEKKKRKKVSKRKKVPQACGQGKNIQGFK